MSARPAGNRPAAATNVTPDERLVRAAARILARHHHPEWRPSSDDIDAWGHGYSAGVRDKLTQDRGSNGNGAAVILDGEPIPEWPHVTAPGGGE